MSAGNETLLIEQGTTFVYGLAVFDSDGATPPVLTPRDLSAVTEIRMQIRKTKDAPTTIASYTETGGDFVWDNQSDGEFTLTVSAADTAAMSIVNAVFDLELVFTAVVERLIQGPVVLSLEVTK